MIDESKIRDAIVHGSFRPLQALLIEEKPKPVVNRT